MNGSLLPTAIGPAGRAAWRAAGRLGWEGGGRDTPSLAREGVQTPGVVGRGGGNEGRGRSGGSGTPLAGGSQTSLPPPLSFRYKPGPPSLPHERGSRTPLPHPCPFHPSLSAGRHRGTGRPGPVPGVRESLSPHLFSASTFSRERFAAGVLAPSHPRQIPRAGGWGLIPPSLSFGKVAGVIFLSPPIPVFFFFCITGLFSPITERDACPERPLCWPFEAGAALY